MLEIKKIKVGLLIWWSADRSFGNCWSCPCIVTAVKRTGFKVRTLDNFTETDWLRMHDTPGGDGSSRHEMRECTLPDIKEYFRKTAQELREGVFDASNDLVKAREVLKRYKKRSVKFLSQFDN